MDSFVGRVIEGDCIEVMAQMPSSSVDAVVCDPPYGLAFMGKDFDDPKAMAKAMGFRRTLNPNDITRDSVFGRTTASSPEYQTTGAGRASKPGIGERDVDWPSNAGWNSYRCRKCGHLSHGGSPCKCSEPDFIPSDDRWHVYQSWTEAWAREAYRVLKPGGHLVCAGATRTHHRQWVAIEDAGFEIRDQIMHVFLSGFPKSTDISKAIDKLAGATREVVGVKPGHEQFVERSDDHAAGTRMEGWDRPWKDDPDAVARSHQETAPATDEAKQWQGWGSALKPAYEPWLLARKPLAGTLAQNTLRYGVGGLNIDGTRIPLEAGEEYVINTFDDGAKPFGGGAGHSYTSRKVAAGREGEPSAERRYTEEGSTNFAATPGPRGGDSRGRWPSNITMEEPVFDGGVEGVVGGGDRSSGVMRGGTQRNSRSIDYGKMPDTATLTDTYGDSGGISRFFIIPKAARSEKEPNWHGLDEMEGDEQVNTLGPMAGRGQPGLKCRNCGRWKVSGNPCVCPEPDFEQTTFVRPKVHNDHPTVKPLDLMCHLVRMVCPPGGIVLDPFLGSGTTAKAAELEGRRWIGIEKDERYARIARARLEGTQQGFGLE